MNNAVVCLKGIFLFLKTSFETEIWEPEHLTLFIFNYFSAGAEKQ